MLQRSISVDQLSRVSSSDSHSSVVSLLSKVDAALLKPQVVEQLQKGVTEDLPEVALSTDVSCTNPNLTGGKGSSLAILNAVADIEVPPFFCVTTVGFRKVLESSSNAQSSLESLQQRSDNPPSNTGSSHQKWLQDVFQIAAELRLAIQKLKLSPEIMKAVEIAYKELCDKMGQNNAAVAVRSSATTEDTKDASFAGQHDTFLNQCGVQDVITSVRNCFASVFTDRAVEYRNRNKIKHKDAVMCAVVQAMVVPTVAGTAFSLELSTGFPSMHVAASYGLGEAVVSGEVTADEWLIDKKDSTVIKRVLGSKLVEYVARKDKSGVDCVDVDQERRARFCLPSDTVQTIATGTRRIADIYKQLFDYDDVDTEFAVDSAGKVLLLQSRPVVAMPGEDIKTVSLKNLQRDSVLITGSYSLLGAVVGKAKVIEHFDDLVNGKVSIEADDIIFTAKTANYWNQYLTNLRGIVTMEGSPTAHPMLIGRERHLPVICGVPGLMEAMLPHNGQTITIDGLKKKVYLGEQALTTATHDELEGQFKTQGLTYLASDEEGLKFLRSWNRCTQDDSGDWWVYNPNWEMSPAWREMTAMGYPRRFHLVNSARKSGTELKADPLVNEVRFYNNKVADKLQPQRETMSIFDGLSLEESQKFDAACAEVGERYLVACKAFGETPSVESWKEYVSLYAELMGGVMYLHYWWQIYLKQQSSWIAKDLGMSKLHFEQLLVMLQEQQDELDVRLRREIVSLAARCSPHIRVEGNPKELSRQELLELCLKMPELPQALAEVACQYRLQEITDIAPELPLDLLLTKILDEVKQNPNRTIESLPPYPHHGAPVLEFYPDHPDLCKWASLSVATRVQKSNLHHLRLRGQWQVREGLKKVASTLDIPLSKIFQAATPSDIENYIRQSTPKSRRKRASQLPSVARASRRSKEPEVRKVFDEIGGGSTHLSLDDLRSFGCDYLGFGLCEMDAFFNKNSIPSEGGVSFENFQKPGVYASLNPFLVSKKSNEVILRKPGSLHRQQVNMEDCDDCEIYICDRTAQVFADACKRCLILIGPCSSSAFIRDCEDCVFWIACKQFRTRNCKRCTFFTYVKTEPIIESSSDLIFAPWCAKYPKCSEQFKEEGFDPERNLWNAIFDFTGSADGSHWSISDYANVMELTLELDEPPESSCPPDNPVPAVSYERLIGKPLASGDSAGHGIANIPQTGPDMPSSPVDGIDVRKITVSDGERSHTVGFKRLDMASK